MYRVKLCQHISSNNINIYFKHSIVLYLSETIMEKCKMTIRISHEENFIIYKNQA